MSDRRIGKVPPNKIKYPAPCLHCGNKIMRRPTYKHRLCVDCRSDVQHDYYVRHRTRILKLSRLYWGEVRKPQIRHERRPESVRRMINRHRNNPFSLGPTEDHKLIDFLLREKS